MKLVFHKNFEKGYAALKAGEKEKCDERLAQFFQDRFDATLNNHPLRGKYTGYRSINISGDLRAIYRQIDNGACFFIAIGPHEKLYRS